MCKGAMRIIPLVLCFVLLLSVGGVWAVWTYAGSPEEVSTEIPVTLSAFHYADIYITRITPLGSGGTMTKTGHTTAQSSVTGSTSFEVTFYNGSNVTYYYNEAQTIAGSGNYTVSGITKGDAVDSKTYKTITVSFAGSSSATIFFSFVVDKDSITEVVATTAVDRFLEILNSSTEYATLTNAMNNRSGWNKASAVTYIGNVAGSGSGDSGTMNGLFGDEFMSMDLDGDGNPEPITMMIKRENLDGNESTGCTYTYSNYGRQYTVNGAEMTLYITAENVQTNNAVVVYAAVFTMYEGHDQWVELVPLTKGTAETNNYSGWGTSNSFDTDTWRDANGRTIEELIAALPSQ